MVRYLTRWQSTWLPKKKDDPLSTAQKHQARPLESLKDPSAFGAPPKNVNYHGGAAVPDRITPDRRGLGAPLSVHEVSALEETSREPETIANKPEPPPVPYRANTTGLSTRNLPIPPVRRTRDDVQVSGTISVDSATAVKPTLPPRLPPRQNSTPTQRSPSPPPPYSPTMPARSYTRHSQSHGAANPSGIAGSSVLGQGLRKSDSPDQEAMASPAHPTTRISELSSRFGRISTETPSSEVPAQGTSFADKQAALKTAQSFRQDPSSVTLADARSTALTAENFRRRHGDQVTSGLRTANAINHKYDVRGRINSQVDSGPSLGGEHSVKPGITSKKPAPPPPPKRVTTGDGSSPASPPPIPLSSKPKP